MIHPKTVPQDKASKSLMYLEMLYNFQYHSSDKLSAHCNTRFSEEV